MSGFQHRRLDVAFALGKGTFGEDGTQNTVTLSGLRVSVAIVKPGAPNYSEAQIRVYGMRLSDMNQLTMLGKPLDYSRLNHIAVSAGTDGGPMAIAFQGNIQQCWADMNSAPQVPLIVHAVDNGELAMMPIPATSYKGPVDVATAMAGLARQAGLSLENNGVSVMLDNSYLSGAVGEQIKSVAEHAHINHIIENDKLIIWPMDGVRGGLIPLISPETGMVGYPAFTAGGLVIKTLYNPTILFGAQIEVKSELTPACGLWRVNYMSHDLEADTPGGQWFTTMVCDLNFRLASTS